MDLILPQLSSTMEAARVLRWLKRPGDRLRMGEAVVEVETDKATVEVESPTDGMLAEVLVAEGEEAAVGGTLARLSASDGSMPTAAVTPKPSIDSPAPSTVSPVSSTATQTSSTVTSVPSTPMTGLSNAGPIAAAKATQVAGESATVTGGTRIKASPLARRLAAEAGLDLRTVRGSGPDSRIRKRDILRIRSSLEAGSGTGIGTRTAVSSPSATWPLSPMRARIAETVSASRRLIPSYSLDRWVETSHLATVQAKITTSGGSEKITFTDMLLQALADALSQVPSMLDRWLDEAPQPAAISSSTIDIGLIVALEQGLVIPTLRDLANKDLLHIARARHQAVERARAGRLTATDHAPASITLSNLGKSGVDRFEAIINPGQSSILAVGREHERPLASGGRLYAARGVNLTLSVDHRLIDGRLGAEFLGSLANRIEQGSWRLDRGGSL